MPAIRFGVEFAFDPPGDACCNTAMLGKIRRTTTLDVGFALSFAGLAYLVWVLVAGMSRLIVQHMIVSFANMNLQVHHAAYVVKIIFVDWGFVIDIVGLLWLTFTLVLVLLSSRQLFVISWAWVAAILQSSVAALGAVLVGWAAYQPFIGIVPVIPPEQTPLETVSTISLAVLTPVAIFIWLTFLVWLLVERARLNRRGPSLRDGLKSNIFR